MFQETREKTPLEAKIDSAPVFDGTEWPMPDMSLLNGSRADPPEFPIRINDTDTKVLGYWSDWVEQKAEGAGVSADYIACLTLTVFGSLIGNARWVEAWPGWRHPPFIWVALVGDASSNKSPAMNAIFPALADLETDLAHGFADTLRQHDALVEAAQLHSTEWKANVKTAIEQGRPPPSRPEKSVDPQSPERPRLVAGDTTIEALGDILYGNPKGVLVKRDELSGWLTSFDRYSGGGDRSFWLECFNGDSYVIDRKKHKDDPINIRHLAVGVCGGLHPEKLQGLLFDAPDDGLAARLLMCWPNSVPPTRPINYSEAGPFGPIGSCLKKLIELEMVDDGQGNTVPKILALTDDAAELFQSWRKKNYLEEQATSGLYRSHIGKFPGLVLRLSLILEFMHWNPVDPEPENISAQSVSLACLLIHDYFQPMALRCYADAALPEADRNAAKIFKVLKATGLQKFNARMMGRQKVKGARFPRLKAAERNEALKILEDGYIIRAAPTRSGEMPGVQTSDYVVNPGVHQDG